MSLKNRINKVEYKTKDIKKIVNYTVLDSEVVNGEVVGWVCERESEGKIDVLDYRGFQREYDRSLKGENVEANLILDYLSVEQLKELIKRE